MSIDLEAEPDGGITFILGSAQVTDLSTIDGFDPRGSPVEFSGSECVWLNCRGRRRKSLEI